MNKHREGGGGLGPAVSWGFAGKPQDQADEDLWDLPIPLGPPDLSAGGQAAWTYRRYFQAITKELSHNDFAIIQEVLGRIRGQRFDPMALDALRIIAEKHGNFYHPARIEVSAGKEIFRFVLNVALTDRGRSLLPQEVRTLIHLGRKYPYPFLPKVYFSSVVHPSPDSSPKGDQSLAFFLAQWFDGFHEFHWSLDPQGGQRRIRLWDGKEKACFLSRTQEERLVTQGAKILTCYYDPDTYEQIYPWHHGAGDFVACVEGEKVEVRLISARNYGPLIEPGQTDPLEALLFFFLNLSLRIRLDRLDGSGETLFAEDHCLAAAWKGFLEALEIKQQAGEMTSSFLDQFFRAGARLTFEDLLERFSDILESYNPNVPDLPLLREGLVSHTIWVHRLLRKGKV